MAKRSYRLSENQTRLIENSNIATSEMNNYMTMDANMNMQYMGMKYT